jgi:polysaccharide biosynthesis/export protein
MKMNHKAVSPLFYYLLLLALVPGWWSCGNVRELQYMQGQFDTAKLAKIKYPETVIQSSDILSITVYSDNAQASAYYNLPAQTNVFNTGAASPAQSNVLTAGSNYLVDDSGYIQFPGLGQIYVRGLSKEKLYAELKTRLTDKLQNPYFIIRLMNYRVTLIGEVNRPGQFNIPNERVSVLEAIGLAGDLTPFGRRDNVLIIREINGERTFGRIDLRSPDILSSPYYFLQPNDVIYVDPTRNKAAASDQVAVRNITLATSIVSMLAILIGVFN